MVQPRRVARGTGPVTALAMLRVAGRLTLARGGADGVTLLDVESGGLVGHLDGGRPVPVQTLSVVTDERDDRPLLAVGGVDGVVRLWDVARQEQVSEVAIGDGAVWALTTLDAPEGSLVAGVCSRQIRIWHWRHERIRDLALSDGQTWSLCPLRLGRQTLLVSGHVDGGIQLWDPHEPAAPVRVLGEAHRGSVWALAPFTMAGTAWLASGGADRAIKMWQFSDVLAEPLIVDGLAAEGTVRQLAAIPRDDGDLLVSGSAAGLVDIWRPDPTHPTHLRTFTGHRGEVWSVACARDGDRTVVASGDINGQVRLADLRANVEDATTVSVLHSSASTIWCLAALPGPAGGLLAGGGVDSTVRVIDLAQSVVRHSLAGHQSTVRALAAGPDPAKPTLISGGADGTIRVWDPIAGKERATLAHGRGEVWALVPVRLGGDDFVVSGGADGSVRLWSLDGAGPAVETLVENAGEISTLAVAPTPQGPLIACGGSAGLRLIELGPRRLVHQVFTLTTWAVTTVTLGNRTLVVCARADGSVVLLDPATRQVTANLALPDTPVQVRSLTVVPQQTEQWIVGGCHDGRILIWHAESGTLLTELTGVHVGTVRAVVTVTEDGRSDLYSAGDDGQVRRWALAGPALRLLDEIRPGTRLASILLSDQPEREDRLGRGDLVATLHELLTDPRTTPPVVVGVHAAWGQGKTSVLLQLRELLDRTQRGPGWTDPPAPTHELTPRDARVPARGWLARTWRRLRERWQGGPVRTRLTRSWAWRQVQRGRERAGGPLPYRMRRVVPTPAGTAPGDPVVNPAESAAAQRTTVWFSPWMYTSAEQMWAGLTQEVLNSVTRRLPPDQRNRLWFDLNLRRTDPARMRRRILEDLIPSSLPGLALNVALVALPVVVVVAMVVSASQNPNLESLVGPVALVTASAVLVLANLALFAFRHIRGTLPPGVLEGPSPGGVAPPAQPAEHDWRGDRDPLRHSGRGYLYLVQHDVREIIALASEEAPIVIFVDDLDRCTPEVVADTIEAINLFLNNAFGDCMFVLALDPATVAAHLETAHEALQRRIDSDEASYGQLRHIGWRFMEKIIELPIRLPGLTSEDLGAYVNDLISPEALGPAPALSAAIRAPSPESMPASQEAGTPPPRPRRGWLPRPRVPADDLLPLDDPRPRERTPAASREAAAPLRDGSPASTPVVATVAITADVPAAAETAAQVDYVEHIMDVQRELREAALMLPRRSPRQTKSFINLWRFYMSLEYRAGRLPQHFREIAQHGRAMARFVGMVLRFPRLLDAVSYPSPATFRRLVTAAGDEEMWQEVLAGCRLSGVDPAVRELRELLRDPTTSPGLLADIGERYL